MSKTIEKRPCRDPIKEDKIQGSMRPWESQKSSENEVPVGAPKTSSRGLQEEPKKS